MFNPKLIQIYSFKIYVFTTTNYTGWPRKNATTLIVNIKDIVNKNEFVFYFTG